MAHTVSGQHGGQSADVDEGIAPLVLALWRRGMRTLSSCEDQEGTPGIAWVAFATRAEAEAARRVLGPSATVFRPEEQDREAARAAGADDYRDYPDAAGVAFPKELLAGALEHGGQLVSQPPGESEPAFD